MSRKILTFAIISTVILLLALGMLFYPFLNFKESISSEKNPKIEYVITKFDLFKPKVTTLLPLDDGTIYASVSDFERYNLIFFRDTGYNDGIKKPIDEGSVDARFNYGDLQKAKEIASKNDLSKVNPDVKNIDGVGRVVDNNSNKKALDLSEAKKSENYYYDLIKTEQPELKRDINSFTDLMLDMNISDIRKKYGSPDLSTTTDNITKLDELQYLINSKNINFIAMGFDSFGNLKDDSYKLNSKLKKIVIVKQDRTFVEVPTKPDGSFDFESVKSKWE